MAALAALDGNKKGYHDWLRQLASGKKGHNPTEATGTADAVGKVH